MSTKQTSKSKKRHFMAYLSKDCSYGRLFSAKDLIQRLTYCFLCEMTLLGWVTFPRFYAWDNASLIRWSSKKISRIYSKQMLPGLVFVRDLILCTDNIFSHFLSRQPHHSRCRVKDIRNCLISAIPSHISPASQIKFRSFKGIELTDERVSPILIVGIYAGIMQTYLTRKNIFDLQSSPSPRPHTFLHKDISTNCIERVLSILHRGISRWNHTKASWPERISLSMMHHHQSRHTFSLHSPSKLHCVCSHTKSHRRIATQTQQPWNYYSWLLPPWCCSARCLVSSRRWENHQLWCVGSFGYELIT